MKFNILAKFLFLLLLIFVFVFIYMHNKKSINNSLKKKKSKIDCIISPRIEISCNPRNENLIGKFEEIYSDTFIQSNGWNIDFYPYPKKFDLKLKLINEECIYDNAQKNFIEQINLDLFFYFVITEDANCEYLLNPKYKDTIYLLRSEKVIIDSCVTIRWFRSINLEKYYLKFIDNGYFISKIVINTKINNDCFYEYSFQMRSSDD